jgi:hypothetical protein
MLVEEALPFPRQSRISRKISGLGRLKSSYPGKPCPGYSELHNWCSLCSCYSLGAKIKELFSLGPERVSVPVVDYSRNKVMYDRQRKG